MDNVKEPSPLNALLHKLALQPDNGALAFNLPLSATCNCTPASTAETARKHVQANSARHGPHSTAS